MPEQSKTIAAILAKSGNRALNPIPKARFLATSCIYGTQYTASNLQTLKVLCHQGLIKRTSGEFDATLVMGVRFEWGMLPKVQDGPFISH